jgi:flagellin-like protein
MKLNSTNTDGERAVSPVIGVILMVAITVILAAVIGAFVLDLGSNQSQTASAGLSIEDSQSNPSDDNGEITITVNDPGNVDEIIVRQGGTDISTTSTVNAGTEITVTADSNAGTANQGSGTIQIVGVVDGDESVIRSYDYDFT